MKKLVSVIVPVYNTAPYLEKLVQTAFENHMIDIEIIAVDDCSTDNSIDVLEELSQRYNIKIIKNSQNKGAGACRNQGLKEAKGEYIIFFDGDDFFHEGALDALVRAAIISDADCVIGQYKQCDISGEKIRRMTANDGDVWKDFPATGYHILTDREKNKILGLGNYPWIKLYTSDLIKKDECSFSHTAVNNDIKTHWVSIQLAQKICLLPQVITYHRVDSQHSQITNISDERRLGVLTALGETNTFFTKNMDILAYLKFLEFQQKVILWAWNKIDEKYKNDFLVKTRQHIEQLRIQDVQDFFLERKIILKKYGEEGNPAQRRTERSLLAFFHQISQENQRLLD